MKKVLQIRYLFAVLASLLAAGAQFIFANPQISLPDRVLFSMLIELPALVLTAVALFAARSSARWQRVFYWILLFFLALKLYFRATLGLDIVGSQF